MMRFRDYFSFMQFARDEQVVVVVCGASPAAGRWIGKPGVRCYGGRLPVPTSETAPNDGLLAADPADSRLIDMLGRYDPPLLPVSSAAGRRAALRSRRRRRFPPMNPPKINLPPTALALRR